MSSEAITKNDLTKILNKILMLDGVDMTESEVTEFIDSLNLTAANAVDYIVEEGTDNGWTYRKWNSGIAEAWTLVSNGSTAMTTAEGYGYYASAKTYTFPSIFRTIKSVVTLADLSGALGGFVSSNITTTSLTGYFWATKSVTKNTFLNIEVKGTWK